MIVLVCPKKLGALYCDLTELNVGSMTLEEDFMGHNSITFEENEVHISGWVGTWNLQLPHYTEGSLLEPQFPFCLFVEVHGKNASALKVVRSDLRGAI